ncbi:MAG: hypothetical protein HRT63_05675 [Erythrobacter sp.]|nr:hypothetical protein [Erythrobacter sp.]
MKLRFLSVAVIGFAVSACSGVASADVLANYVPEAECDDAEFELIEREDSPQDWFYVVTIKGSSQCSASLQRALASWGAKESTIPLVNGLLLPGHTDPEQEAVAFDFIDDSHTVVWTRDKR